MINSKLIYNYKYSDTMRLNTSPSYRLKENRPSNNNTSTPLLFNEFMKNNKPHPKR